MQAQGLGGHTSRLRPWIIAGVANMKPWEEDQSSREDSWERGFTNTFREQEAGEWREVVSVAPKGPD